ncbi:flagellar motor switch protein FliN [Herbaspirillum sp. meg3]|jgi:flagellar motor switch protein FliN/FliY|uniref:flagellar motor switch protein FliN n=1 Tax=Herbaspirillum sp. meg3 TaxID=2025949 RepID=UPI000B998037|nr:flagellar motor switch protein FliN [Herbaspirillum sp. meg3]ASU38290.1 flagellar motor switch protein FliN [Herbaspirillum sp. meg3]
MAEDNVDQTAAEDDPWGAALAEQTQAEESQKKVPEEEGIAAKPAEATIFKDLSAADLQTNTPNDIDFILDIPVQLTVELGRTKIAIKNLLQLAQGSVVELDGMAGEPMDVLVNGCLIAQGEVVVVNDKFGIRLTDIITPAERIRKLNR